MQRDVLHELAQLVRFHEPDDRNIGPFVAECAGELALLLQSDECELVAAAHEIDGVLVDRLRARLDIALERERTDRDRVAVERAERAALEVGRTVRWLDLGAVLDVDLVLGNLVVGRSKQVVFAMPAGEPVIVETLLLRRSRILRRTFIDVACFIDERAFHLRWHGGRGQLNLSSRAIPARAMHDALVVHVAPPKATHRPALIADVLAVIGFGSRA